MNEQTIELEKPTMKLNPEAKAAILAVLRDPNVVQIREWMYNGGNGFCLAGAICEAYRRTMNEGNWVYGLYPSFKQGPANATELVERWAFDQGEKGKVRIWAGLDFSTKLLFEGKLFNAVRLNYKIDFKALADLIEEQW